MSKEKPIWMGKLNKRPVYKVYYRKFSDMDYIVVSEKGVLLSDRCEGFPRLTAEEVLDELAALGIIELEKENID